MNIKQEELSPKEIELIEKVINFPLFIGSIRICFKDIVDKVELDLSIRSKKIIEKVDINLLKTKIQDLEKEIQIVEKTIKRIHDLSTMEERNRLRSDGPWRKKGSHWGPEDYYGFLLNKKAQYIRTIDNKGEFSTSLLGSFSESEKTIYLYLDNIQKERGTTHRGDRYTFRTFVIVAFIHEMFHAWNYFASGHKERSVLEIDEPMVEFATLLFLKEIAKEYSDYRGKESFASFEEIGRFALESVHDKQDAMGETASYGFGYYMYSLLGLKEEKFVLEMLTEYINKSGNITETEAVKKVKKLLYPYYSFDKESEVLELFYIIIFGGRRGLSEWALDVFEYVKRIPSNDFYMDDIYVFEDEIQKKHPNNNNIRAKIRQQLQVLCAKGLIQRVDKGHYRK